jgi:hypothetical protein
MGAFFSHKIDAAAAAAQQLNQLEGIVREQANARFERCHLKTLDYPTQRVILARNCSAAEQ